MRVLHTADLHLGARQYGFQKREQDYYTICDNLLDIAIREKINVVILAGDLFNTLKPPAVAVNTMKKFVDALTKQNIKVLGVDGNHDATNGEWLNVCGIINLHKAFIKIDDIVFGGLHNMRPALFNQELDTISSNVTTIDIFVIHQAIDRLSGFNSAEAQVSLDNLINKLARCNTRYVAAGDIHDYKEVEINNVRVAYSGSPEVTALDEQFNKCCSIIDIDKNSIKTNICPIKTRPIIPIEIQNESDIDALIPKLKCDPLVVVSYSSSDAKQWLGKLEAVLQAANVMYLLFPKININNKVVYQKTNESDSKGAIERLKAVISEFFDVNTPQNQLILSCIETPDNIEPIIKKYITGKE